MGLGQHRILLADDSSTMHRAVKLALSRGDYEVFCCDNGTDALRISKEVTPSLIIADLDLPGISGAELVKAIKADSKLASSKIILLCSSIHQGDIGRLDKIPADARLWKPFESEALFTLVLALLRTSSGARPSSTLSTAATQQMSRAEINPEITKPIQKASVLVDRSMPPIDQTENFERVKLTQKDITENLWTSDFDSPPLTSDSTAIREKTAPAASTSKTAYPASPTAAKPDSTSDNLSLYREASSQWESLQSRVNIPLTPPPPPKSPTASSAESPSVSKEEIRNMIRSEVQLAFDSWFKEKLETKLQEILNQIESESKKRS